MTVCSRSASGPFFGIWNLGFGIDLGMRAMQDRAVDSPLRPRQHAVDGEKNFYAGGLLQVEHARDVGSADPCDFRNLAGCAAHTTQDSRYLLV